MRRSRQQRVEDARQVVGAQALADVVRGGMTSSPSPYPQPGVRQTESLTGARLVCDRGWIHPVAVMHLCYPPQEYPDQCGPGSKWRCACDAIWVAAGVMVHKYPVGSGRVTRDVILGPEYWVWLVGTGTDEEKRYFTQQAYWDWRPATDKILHHLNTRWGSTP